MATFKFTGRVSAFADKLVNGMVACGYTEEFARKTFTQLEGFGSYGTWSTLIGLVSFSRQR
jgi:error-prone DNA polymerase